MSVNPPPLKVPTSLLSGADGFWRGLLETVRLLWFSETQRTAQKILEGTTGSSQGSTATVTHGIDAAQLRGVSCVVFVSSTDLRLPGDTETGYQFSVKVGSTVVTVTNHATNSASVLSKPFTILLEYAKA